MNIDSPDRCQHLDQVTGYCNLFKRSVFSLAGKYYEEKYGARLQIINADALTWKPPKGRRYGAVWHDIWANICSENLPEMHKLHRKYGRIRDWQGSWCRWQCERNRREGR